MTDNQSDLWQISVLTDTNQTVLVTINKNESVAKLFKTFREKNRISRRQKSFSFLVADGLELQDNDPRKLVDVDCLRDKCNIRLIVHADGGVWPTKTEIEEQSRDPTKVPSLARRITNDVPDIMGLDDETPRVKMACSHAIAPSSLALHCYHKLDEGADSIQCPSPGCDTVWSFTSIIDAACLSPNETNEFERQMISNSLQNQPLKIKECPGCRNSCRRLNDNDKRIRCWKCTSDKARKFDFCWSCMEEWGNNISTELCGNLKCGDHSAIFEYLATCETKILLGIECPSRRACPCCMMLIEHKNKCKRMVCPKQSCKYNFCFICLKGYPCGTGTYKACSLAPRQQTISPPPPPPPPPPSNCSIL